MDVATQKNWPDLKPMSSERAIVELEIMFDANQTRNLKLGFVPSDQNEKWFLYYESDTLHFHRSWTGLKMFEVRFVPEGDGMRAAAATVSLAREIGGDSLGARLDMQMELLRKELEFYATDKAHVPYVNSFLTTLSKNERDDVRPKSDSNPSFEEQLRMLRAAEDMNGSDEEDHNPEDDEDLEEEDPQPGPPVHPRLDEHGKVVKLSAPSTPTAQWTWQSASTTAIVIPDGPMPEALAGILFSTWNDHPGDNAGWQKLGKDGVIEEPEFKLPAGKKAAAGVVVVEEDGRVWAVAPSNAFGGYPVTFPKGTRDSGVSMQATALREAFEEAGLQVELTGFLVDVPRSLSYTRYYLARRKGGSPADMGWESQAVMLIPVDDLPQRLTNKNDVPIIKALKASLR